MSQTLYLVMVRTMMDDLPILLTSDLQEAEAKSRNATQEELDAIVGLLKIDPATYCSTAIITFRDGKPVEMRIVHAI